MKDKIKKSIRVIAMTAPWVALLVMGVFYSANVLADWHFKEFTEPFLK